MKCPACTTEAPAGSAFCPHCGERLDASAAQQPAAAAAPIAPPAGSAGRGPSSRAAAGPAADASIYTEEELWSGRYSPKAMLGTWITVGLIALGLFVLAVLVNRKDVWLIVLGVIPLLGLVVLVVILSRRLGTHYRLTTQRLILERGLLSLTTDRIDIIDIDDITVEQGPIGRLMKLGTILVRSTDKTHGKLQMVGIDNVHRVADLMDNARRAIQRRRGMRIDVTGAESIEPGHASDQ